MEKKINKKKNRYFQFSCVLESTEKKVTTFKSLLYASEEFPSVEDLRDVVQKSTDPIYDKFQLSGIHEFKYKSDFDKWSKEMAIKN